MKPKGQTSDGFPCAQYLHALKREGVPEERVRYYTGWVESFRRFQKSRPPEGLGPEEAQDFLRALSERPRIQLWQVRQAAHALKVFYRGVLGAEWCEQWETPATNPGTKTASPLPASTAPDPEGYTAASPEPDPPFPAPTAESVCGLEGWPARLRAVMRTGNYSFSTERAYAVWTRRFLSFCAERSCKPDAGSVRDFLEHLALAREVAGGHAGTSPQRAGVLLPARAATASWHHR